MRRAAGALLAGLLVLGTAACAVGQDETRPRAAAELTADRVLEPITAAEPVLPVTVDSADGRRVTVTDVSRILPLWGSISEIVFTLGMGDRVVGRDAAATFAGAEHLPLVTRAHDVSAEGVLSLRPTLIIAQTDTGPAGVIEQLVGSGIPVVVLERADSIDDIAPRIRRVAQMLGIPGTGEELVRRTQERMDAAQAAIPAGGERPRTAFLYLRGNAGVYMLGGRGSGADAMIEEAGGRDVGSESGLGSFTPLTPEAMVKAAPDVILVMRSGLKSVGGVDGALKLAGIAQTPAGRDRRIVAVDDELLLSFGPRTPKVLQDLVGLLHER